MRDCTAASSATPAADDGAHVPAAPAPPAPTAPAHAAPANTASPANSAHSERATPADPAPAGSRVLSVIHVEMTTASDPRFAALVAATEVDLAVRYQAAEPIAPLKPDHVVEAILACVDGDPVGCVALAVPPDRPADPSAAPVAMGGASSSTAPDQTTLGEVKRLYVTPDARRCGIARALIREVEARAATRGLAALVLETGTAQPEAMALYESLGFHQIANYSAYADDPRSRCYAKHLRDPAPSPLRRVSPLGAETGRSGPQR